MALYKVKVSAYSRTCIANICSDVKSATKRMRARIFELAILNCDFIFATRFITIRKGAREIDIRSIFHSIFFFFRFDVAHNQDSTFGIKYDLLIEVSIAENINFATLCALIYSCGYREKYRMTFVRVIKMWITRSLLFSDTFIGDRFFPVLFCDRDTFYAFEINPQGRYRGAWMAIAIISIGRVHSSIARLISLFAGIKKKQID